MLQALYNLKLTYLTLPCRPLHYLVAIPGDQGPCSQRDRKLPNVLQRVFPQFWLNGAFAHTAVSRRRSQNLPGRPWPYSTHPNIVILPWHFDTILIKDHVGLWIVPPPPLPLGTLLPPRSPPCISRRFETACAAPLSRDVPAVFIPVWQLPKRDPPPDCGLHLLPAAVTQVRVRNSL